MVRAMVGFLGARGAARRPLGRRPAGGAEPARPALGVELAAPVVLAFGRPAGLFDRGAGAAARQAVEDRPAAAGAEPGGAALVILLPLRRLALVAARRAGRPALDGRVRAAPDAQAGLAPRLLALPALGAGAAALGVRIGAAVIIPSSGLLRDMGPVGRCRGLPGLRQAFPGPGGADPGYVEHRPVSGAGVRKLVAARYACFREFAPLRLARSTPARTVQAAIFGKCVATFHVLPDDSLDDTQYVCPATWTRHDPPASRCGPQSQGTAKPG